MRVCAVCRGENAQSYLLMTCISTGRTLCFLFYLKRRRQREQLTSKGLSFWGVFANFVLADLIILKNTRVYRLERNSLVRRAVYCRTVLIFRLFKDAIKLFTSVKSNISTYRCADCFRNPERDIDECCPMISMWAWLVLPRTKFHTRIRRKHFR